MVLQSAFSENEHLIQKSKIVWGETEVSMICNGIAIGTFELNLLWVLSLKQSESTEKKHLKAFYS